MSIPPSLRKRLSDSLPSLPLTILCSYFLFSSGCGEAQVPPTGAATQRSASHKSAGFPKSIVKHLGTVLAGQKREHIFQLANKTGSDWFVRKVRSTCSCTVGEVSAERVVPGESLAVKVQYSAPSKTSEDTRAVYVTLEDMTGSIEEVACKIQASVRERITVRPLNLRLDVSSKSTASCSFQVENWTEADWKSLEIKPSIDWISCQARPLATVSHESGKGPRQAWQVEVSAMPAARRLDKGNAREAQLALFSVGQEPRDEKTIPLELLGNEEVQVVPSVLVLRQAANEESLTAKTVLKFAETINEFDAKSVKITDNLPSHPSYHWKPKSPREWELTVQVSAAALSPGSPAKGTLILSFPTGQVPALELPVYCLLSTTGGPKSSK